MARESTGASVEHGLKGTADLPPPAWVTSPQGRPQQRQAGRPSWARQAAVIPSAQHHYAGVGSEGFPSLPVSHLPWENSMLEILL